MKGKNIVTLLTENMKRIKYLDIVIIGFALLLIVFSGVILVKNMAEGSWVRITANDSDYIYSLEDDSKINVEGILGESVIIIQDGQVYFESSPCENKICVHSSPLTGASGFIACLPNKVFLSIEKSHKNITQFDSICY